jgi:hypothetical protein
LRAACSTPKLAVYLLTPLLINTNTFRKFQIFLNDDPPITLITADQARAFFASLNHLSKKILLPCLSDTALKCTTTAQGSAPDGFA